MKETMGRENLQFFSLFFFFNCINLFPWEGSWQYYFKSFFHQWCDSQVKTSKTCKKECAHMPLSLDLVICTHVRIHPRQSKGEDQGTGTGTISGEYTDLHTTVCWKVQNYSFIGELQCLAWPLGHKTLLYQMIQPQHVNIRTIILKVLHI